MACPGSSPTLQPEAARDPRPSREAPYMPDMPDMALVFTGDAGSNR
jgi:hypothetical protein